MKDFMVYALKQAKEAYHNDEVPIGAVIVKDNKIIARGQNRREKTQNALTHAEICAIDKACKKLKSWRLDGCQMYVTLEPCPMCAGACINSRLKRVVFGAYDKKAGCCGTLYNLVQDKRFNHRLEVLGGVLEKDCANVLSEYFKTKRGRK